MLKTYDVIVIGAGPAGYYAAIRSSQLGLHCALIEMDKPGGTCTNYGCIPTKSYFAVARLLNQSKRASEFGLKGNPLKPDITSIVENKDKVVKKLSNGVQQLLKINKIDFYTGQATFSSGKNIEISSTKGKEKLSAGNYIICTGSEPARLPIVEYDGKRILTSKDILNLKQVPESLLVVGGGVIGVELAGIFNTFGSRVIIVEMLADIIPFEDKEISGFLKKQLTAQGIEVYTSSKLEKIQTSKGKIKAHVTLENGKKEFNISHVLICIGRKAYTGDLGLEKIGLGKNLKSIEVNNKMETGSKNIYAAGDVTGRAFLAYTASAMGLTAAENIGGRKYEYNDTVVPNCIWTSPEIASVGLKEEEAKNRGYDISIGKFPFAASGKAISIGETHGFVKAIVDNKYKQVLGIHIIGPKATSLITEASMALKCEATVDEFDRIIHAHPTLSEGIMEAVHNAVGSSIDIPSKPR